MSEKGGNNTSSKRKRVHLLAVRLDTSNLRIQMGMNALACASSLYVPRGNASFKTRFRGVGSL